MPGYETSFKYRRLKFPKFYAYEPLEYRRKYFLIEENSDKGTVKKKKQKKQHFV